MVAAEEMGHKGVRAMSPLDTTLATALRVKLGKGRDLPEEPKPKRPTRAKVTKEPGAEDAAEAKKPVRVRKAKTAEGGAIGDEEAVELKPAATIVKPKPATAEGSVEIAPPAPLLAKREPEPLVEPRVAQPAPPLEPAAAATPPAAPATKKPE